MTPTTTSTPTATTLPPSWAARPPAYRRQKCITLRPDVFDAINAKRPAGASWSAFLCDALHITPPPDRRRNRAP